MPLTRCAPRAIAGARSGRRRRAARARQEQGRAAHRGEDAQRLPRRAAAPARSEQPGPGPGGGGRVREREGPRAAAMALSTWAAPADPACKLQPVQLPRTAAPPGGGAAPRGAPPAGAG
eukprot:scaffold4287_cov285-Prasinococcus_capsulatus_cf.AAC.1